MSVSFIQGTIEQAQREAVWAVANITAGGTVQQVDHIAVYSVC